MTIWKFNSVTNNFTQFLYMNGDDIGKLIFLMDGAPKNWPTRPQCRPLVEKQKKKQLPPGDLSYISPGTILLNGKAYNALRDFLLPFGQLLEVECVNEGGLLGDKESEIYYLYNVTNIIPCVDYENSEKIGSRITKEVYLPDLAPTTVQIFKDPRRVRLQIYLSEAAKEQFTKLIADSNLTGGEFVQ